MKSFLGMKNSLAGLWKMRATREEQFGEVVNLLQGLFLGRDVEEFTHDQLTCLQSVFDKLFQEATYDDDFVNAITIELLGVGLDVFRGIGA